MNREKANELLNDYGKPAVVIGKTLLKFARQQESDITEIESKSDEELISEWKGLSWMNCIYGQVSVNDLQRIALIELEMDTRTSINKEELCNWFKKADEEFDEEEFHKGGK